MFKLKEKGKGATIPRTIRFTEELFSQLNQFAAEHNVSFNSLVLQCCEYALDNYEDESSKEDKWYLVEKAPLCKGGLYFNSASPV